MDVTYVEISSHSASPCMSRKQWLSQNKSSASTNFQCSLYSKQR